jgi:hypothetical protein
MPTNKGQGRGGRKANATVQIPNKPAAGSEGEEFDFEGISYATSDGGRRQGLNFMSYRSTLLIFSYAGPSQAPANLNDEAASASVVGSAPLRATTVSAPSGRGIRSISTGVIPIPVTTATTNHAPDIDHFFERGNATQGTRSICKLCKYVSHSLSPHFFFQNLLIN